jgi:hypothetical protein
MLTRHVPHYILLCFLLHPRLCLRGQSNYKNDEIFKQHLEDTSTYCAVNESSDDRLTLIERIYVVRGLRGDVR